MALLYSKSNGDGSYEVINQIEARARGWGQNDVQLGWDNKWYLVGQVPAKSQEVINRERMVELKANIAATDSIILELLENALVNGDNFVMPIGTDTDYATILSNRAAWREELKQLKD